jgi:hypothetical protein
LPLLGASWSPSSRALSRPQRTTAEPTATHPHFS